MKQIKSLQGLRFLAALLVFAHHVRIFYKNGPLSNYLYYFYTGVTFFFILSGFVLTYRYAPNFRKKTGFPVKHFYLKRLLSIYPLHIITLVMSLAVINLSLFTWGKLTAHLFLLQTFTADPGVFFYFNSLSWFLSDMMFLYIIFPPLISFLFRIKNNDRSRKVLAITVTALYALGYIVFTSLFLIRKTSQDYYLFYFAPFARLTDFLAGVTLGLIFPSGGGKNISYRLTSLAEFLLLASVPVSIFFIKLVPDLFRWDLYFIPVFFLIILLFAKQKGLFSAWLSRPVMEYLGRISFPFIMFQWVVITYVFESNFSHIPLVSVSISLFITIFFSAAYNRIFVKS